MREMLILILICTTTITIVTGLVMCAPLRLNFEVATGGGKEEEVYYDSESEPDHAHKD